MRGPCSIEPATGGSEWYRARNGRLALMEWVLTLSTAAAVGAVGQYAGMATLDVMDGREPISISFEDLLKYHGRSSIGGLAGRSKS